MADSRPSFEELQTWALANGFSGATDQEAYDGWIAAHPEKAAIIATEAALCGVDRE